MHHTHCLLLLLAGLQLLSHRQPVQASNDTSSKTYAEFSQSNVSSYQIAPGNANFAFRLYHLIASQNSAQNIFFSPLSISFALVMLSTGAGGVTQTQILEGLGFNLTELSVPEIHEGFRLVQHRLSRPSTELSINVGNALILSQDLQLLSDFVSTTKAFYDCKVLLSLWKKPFPSSEVFVRDFYVDENKVVRVPMMLQDDQEHWYLDDRRVPCTVLRMDYKGDAVAFFILPQKGKMKEVEQVLSPGMLARWNNLLQKRYLYRKFSISNSYALDEILPDLSLQDQFTQHSHRGASGSQTRVFHKASLDVNEAGTDAAASTGVGTMFFSAKHKKRVLVFNQPFFAVIYSTSTQNILFMGKVINPTA
ncbi:hypothetical protein A6R68_07154 [Neotoma lepida]|uniref:Serpin domain-containing protein n=1 Tax=Neotoma lepida TaxID=56216 RepID=A0A1A6GEN1_NEOLE|nr:hypothetical protein A6R68_07154 [Neotoma lepida]